MNDTARARTLTMLFTDIEGSTRLWEQDPARMPHALARHDALARDAVESHRGSVVKMIGDGMHAAFDDPLDAVRAALQFQCALADPSAPLEMALVARCGLHCGAVEWRDNDYFGTTVNRAARIMSIAQGGQVLLSAAVADAIAEHLPTDVTLRDLGAVRLRSLSTPERLYQVVDPRLRQDFPALRSLVETPNNLPRQVTSFVGRERSLDEVKTLLTGARLLTLCGMGGLGKTRLSLEVAADVMNGYADGVWFVELAPVSDARLVPQVVASALGVAEETGRAILDALVNFVKDRQLLLVLDNCEHLLDACATLAKQLLRAGARVAILASSREHLHVAGETVFTVPALALPDPRDAVTVDALARYDAVRLFVDRARALQPAFALTPQNAKAVADICQRLDGIPLALELAAARVSSMSVAMIAERIGDRFRLLTRGDRTALPRQQTLRALIDWSYDLLDARDKTLLARVAVFAGGFDAAAAEAVCADDAIDADSVIDLLSELVEKSLLELDAGGERYRSLETVRQYAREKLDAAGETSSMQSRHLDYFVAFAERVRPQLWGPEQGLWLSRLDLDRENLLAASAHCDHAPQGAERGLRLVFALQLYWLPRGLIELGYRLTVEALARNGAQVRDLNRSGALYAASQLAYFMGAYAETKQHGEECLSIARECAARERAAAALLMLGYASDALGERPAAQAHFEESASIARDLGDKERLSFALNALAGHHAETDDLDLAEPLYEEALTLAREMHDLESIALDLPNLARVLVDRGDAERVRAMLQEALAIAQEIGSTRAAQNVVEVAVGLAILRCDWERAARFYGAVQAQMEELGLRRTPVDDAFLAGRIGKVRAAIGDAAFEVAEMAGRSLSLEEGLGEARVWLEQRD